MKYLNNNNILAQQHYIPIYKFSVCSEKINQLTGAEKYFKNTVGIPIFVSLNNKDQNKVIRIIKNYFI
jgi:dTDP-4-amino-4,6-dideoxygalactose transaminase